MAITNVDVNDAYEDGSDATEVETSETAEAQAILDKIEALPSVDQEAARKEVTEMLVSEM